MQIVRNSNNVSMAVRRPLWQQQNEEQDRGRQDKRRERPAKIEPAVIDRLVEQVADGRAQRAGEDESQPEQRDTDKNQFFFTQGRRLKYLRFFMELESLPGLL